MRSGSGETWTPRASTSSPVLATTVRSEPISSCIPAPSLAPPVPPASSTTLMTASGSLGPTYVPKEPRRGEGGSSRPVVGVGEAGEPDPGVGLVAAVDRDQHRGQLLDDPCHLQRPGVYCP